ncbi:MAG: hypothetical protein LC676_06560 [Loktanella sp.]|nr:hypothetical protein [Loktanella sp.]
MPERDCATCTRQKEWGCFAEYIDRVDEHGDPVLDQEGNPVRDLVNGADLPLTIDGEDTWACPRQTIRENPRTWGRLLMFYGMFTRGHLPDAGAVVDQSAPLMEAIRVIDDANKRCDQALQEQEQRRKSQSAPRKRR